LGYALISVSLTLTILASPSQPMIHSLFLMGCATCYWLVLFTVRREPATLWSTFFLCLSIGTVFLLCAPVIVPTGTEMKSMIRWLGPFGSVIGNAPLPFKAFIIDEAPLAEWIRIFISGPSASLVGSSFIGLIPGALALLSVARVRKNPCVIALLLLALFGLLSSFGTHAGMAYVNHSLPLINKIREPSRHLILFVFATSSLAAIGGSVLERFTSKSVFMIIVTAGLIGHFTQMRQTLASYPDISETDLASDANRDAHAALAAIHSKQKNSFIKIIDTKLPPMFFGMDAFYFDDPIKTVDGYFNPQRYSNHRRIMSLTADYEALMRLSGVTHIICEKCPQNIPFAASTTIGANTIAQLEAVTYPTLYPNVLETDNPFILTTVNGENTAALNANTLLRLLSWPRLPQSITTDVDQTNYKRFTVSAPSSSLFAADNLFSSNWRYYVNGRAVTSFPVNFMRQGVILEAGDKIVEMRYSPRHLSGLFLVSCMGLTLFFGVIRYRKKFTGL